MVGRGVAIRAFPAACELRRLAAFTTDPAGGNPAGVALCDSFPDDQEMQRIAADVGYSETAFLVPAGTDRSYNIRYFSPLAEVPFCGHATIAAAVSVAERDGPGRMQLLTKAGPVSVDVGTDASGSLLATLVSPPAVVERVEEGLLADVLDALSWTTSDLHAALPPARAYAGADHLVVVAHRRSRLADLRYDFERLRRVMSQAGLITVHLVWPESELRYHARGLFPVGGVVEDPATGAAAAAFGAYLRHVGAVVAPCRIVVTQGEDMGRPSTLLVELTEGERGVRVSGHAVALQPEGATGRASTACHPIRPGQ